jgi:hypothetical protein
MKLNKNQIIEKVKNGGTLFITKYEAYVSGAAWARIDSAKSAAKELKMIATLITYSNKHNGRGWVLCVKKVGGVYSV